MNRMTCSILLLAYEHGNDFVQFSAVEKDSLIAVLWHYLTFLSFGCL